MAARPPKVPPTIGPRLAAPSTCDAVDFVVSVPTTVNAVLPSPLMPEGIPTPLDLVCGG